MREYARFSNRAARCTTNPGKLAGGKPRLSLCGAWHWWAKFSLCY